MNEEIILSTSFKIKSLGKIILEIPEPNESIIEPKKINIKIIYEDRNLIVIDKQPGMVVHPGAGNFDDTLVHALYTTVVKVFLELVVSYDLE